MNQERPTPGPTCPGALLWLERLTAALLLVVLLAMGWMVLCAYRPDWFRLAAIEIEVMVMLGLLVLTLILVSLVALLRTRG